MDQRLDGKLALVTGATRGIGRETALALARAGADVVGCYRTDAEAADGVARELAETGGKHRIVRADVTRPEDVQRLMDTCREAGPALDVLVNNVGVDAAATLPELSEAEWQRVLDTDLTTVYRVTRAALPLLAQGASVVSVGSSAAARGVPARAHYGAAKSGVIGLTRSLSKELGPRGVRVNAVAPGIVDVGADGGPSPEIRARMARMSALGRLVTAQEVAQSVLFLASGAAAYVTGVTLGVDGGL